MYEYQKNNRFFAQCPGKMEEYSAIELKEFGCKEIKTAYRGIWFTATLDHIYRINYRSRLISRIIAPLVSFDCHSTRYLYKMAKKIEWSEFLNSEETFAIFSSVSNSKIKHSKYASQVVKDAIVDYFNEKYGKRPSVDKEKPDVWFNLHIDKDKARISLDTSGGPLHKRGYRKKSIEAPMQEILAAAIIKISGWNGRTPLYDPMCGSGTLLSEALLNYCRLPSALTRTNFGFQKLPDYNHETWIKILEDKDRLSRELPDNFVFGSDIAQNAIWVAKTNIESMPFGSKVKLIRRNFKDIDKIENATIVCNPPYGIRLESKEKAATLIKDFGDFLKQRCKHSIAYIYFGNRDLIKNLGLKPEFKIPLVNGNLDGRLVKVEIY